MRASGETVLTGEKEESRVGGGGGRGLQAERQICSGVRSGRAVGGDVSVCTNLKVKVLVVFNSLRPHSCSPSGSSVHGISQASQFEQEPS